MKTAKPSRIPLSGGSVTGATPGRASSITSHAFGTPPGATKTPSSRLPLSSNTAPSKFAPLKKTPTTAAAPSPAPASSKAQPPATPPAASDLGRGDVAASAPSCYTGPEPEPVRSCAASTSESTADSPTLALPPAPVGAAAAGAAAAAPAPAPVAEGNAITTTANDAAAGATAAATNATAPASSTPMKADEAQAGYNAGAVRTPASELTAAPSPSALEPQKLQQRLEGLLREAGFSGAVGDGPESVKALAAAIVSACSTTTASATTVTAAATAPSTRPRSPLLAACGVAAVCLAVIAACMAWVVWVLVDRGVIGPAALGLRYGEGFYQ